MLAVQSPHNTTTNEDCMMEIALIVGGVLAYYAVAFVFWLLDALRERRRDQEDFESRRR